MGGSVLVRGGRVVGLDSEGDQVADVRVRDGVITEVGPSLAQTLGERVVDAAGGWVIPGLWDAHVHMGQWVRSTSWVDASGATCAEDVVGLVADALAGRADQSSALFVFGFRAATWPRRATVAELDTVSGDHPVVAISGDCHSGWLNAAALRLAGLPERPDPFEEAEWFDTVACVSTLPGAVPTGALVARTVGALHRQGVVGVVDFEFGTALSDWPTWTAAGVGGLRVRAGFYPDQLDEVIARGWRSGDPLPGAGPLVRVGPLKVISDGSLGTRTAWCCQPYTGVLPAGTDPCGAPNVSPEELAGLLARAHAAGLACAIHAIGDRANTVVLDAFATTGASGSVEHAQLLCRQDVPRFAELGLVASVQPTHLLDDRDIAHEVWADRTDRAYPIGSLLRAGVTLALGSDAPVSPVDPWAAMAAAVHRSGDDRAPWNPAEALTPREALVSSVDGQRVAPGFRGDVAVLDADPLAPAATSGDAAARLRGVRVRATVCDGEVVWDRGRV